MFTKDGLTKDEREKFFAGWDSEQIAGYFDDLEKYKPSGHFANRQINTFARSVKDNQIVEHDIKNDEGDIITPGVLDFWALNVRQVPMLQRELVAAGYIKEEKAEEAKVTKPLKPIEPVAPPPVSE